MRHRISFAVIFSIALSASLALHAEDCQKSIIPQGWNPSLAAAIESQQADLGDAKAQMQMNRISRRIADMKDAELFVIYLRLSEHLNAKQQKNLLEKQTKWLKARSKYAESAVESEGGSLAAFESNAAESEFTDKRIKELSNKLATYEQKPK